MQDGSICVTSPPQLCDPGGSMRILSACLAACAIIDMSNGVSTKMDFGDEESTAVVTNSSYVDDEDVEVKHTIVVSTKLKNNNRKSLRSNDDGDSGTLSHNIGQKNSKNDDSGEVPVVVGYKSVGTTQIRTPDTRHKAEIYPDSVFITRNIRDQYDNVYPNMASNPMQWKPSSFYNNINYKTPDDRRDSYNERRRKPVYSNTGKLHRKITDDEMREFYCRKCVELNQGQGLRGCTPTYHVQQRAVNPRLYETTTAKIKIDGKLAKLN